MSARSGISSSQANDAAFSEDDSSFVENNDVMSSTPSSSDQQTNSSFTEPLLPTKKQQQPRAHHDPKTAKIFMILIVGTGILMMIFSSLYVRCQGQQTISCYVTRTSSADKWSPLSSSSSSSHHQHGAEIKDYESFVGDDSTKAAASGAYSSDEEEQQVVDEDMEHHVTSASSSPHRDQISVTSDAGDDENHHHNVQEALTTALEEQLPHQTTDQNLHSELKASSTSVLLDAQSFQDIVYDDPTTQLIFVLFSAPWSLASKRISPRWNQFASLYQNDPTILIGHVDCTSSNQAKDICKRHRVQAYPTFLLFSLDASDKNNRVYHRYKGDASFSDLVKTIENAVEESKSHLEQVDEFLDTAE